MAYKQFQWCNMSASRYHLSFMGQKWPEDKSFGYTHDGLVQGRAVDTMAAAADSFYEGSSLVVSSTDDGNITYTANRNYGPINTFSCHLTARSISPEIRFFAGPTVIKEHLDRKHGLDAFDDSPGETDIRAAGERHPAPIAAKVKARAAKAKAHAKAKPKASTKATKATKATGSRRQAS
jgi:hypothetical protein